MYLKACLFVLIACGLAQAQTINVELKPFLNLTTRGDYVAHGVGLRDQTAGSITVNDIPQGANVVKSFLYWGMLDNGESPSLKSLSFDGMPLTGTLVGSGPDTCWGRVNSFAYRAEVTSLVSGNGTHNLTGVASGGAILAQGASLVVIYEKNDAPFRNVILLEGDVVFPAVLSATSPIGGFSAADPVSARTTFIVGDGQPYSETAAFTGDAGTIIFQNPFEGSDGPLWDTKTFDVSQQIAAGPGVGSARIAIGGDCLMWVAQTFSTATTPPIALIISQINDLMTLLKGFNLDFSTYSSLTFKLQAALDALNGSQPENACSPLASFLFDVNRLSGRQLKVSEAYQLTSRVQQIKSELACP